MKITLKKIARILSAFRLPLIFAAAGVIFSLALSNLSNGSSEEGRRALEETLRKTAVACYAAEGAYPQSLDHMIENYGVRVDFSRYNVFYTPVAENLMPDITVTTVTEVRG